MFDETNVYHTNQNLNNEQEPNPNMNQDEASRLFKTFISDYQVGNSFKYKDRITDNVGNSNYTLEVELQDLNKQAPNLYQQFQNEPIKYLSVFEKTLINYVQQTHSIRTSSFQIKFTSNQDVTLLRDLKSEKINQLVNVRGIVINSTRSYIKPKQLAIQCVNCNHQKVIDVSSGLQGVLMPGYCLAKTEGIRQEVQEKCPLNPYVAIPERSEMIDQQEVKIQENPEAVPTGEIPRTFRAVVDRSLVGKLVPGMRLKCVGVYTVIQQTVVGKNGLASNQTVKLPYIQVLGFQQEDSLKRVTHELTEKQIQKFHQMAKEPKIYEKLHNSIAPAIHGRDNIKKAILLQLLGGNRKKLQSNMNLRGDINVLLIGDPSTAKSQMLKFAERVAPVGIYTSGKGSSAAGLTASIGRDTHTGEFQIEGGAMVLADGGLVCIDEFDKMRSEDRIAIHEAMEQQTISIAKAGITTRLNTRCSVLAAANPIYGSYTDLKQVEDQIELQTTILSRFDCIFVIKDSKNRSTDIDMAKRLLSLHQSNSTPTDESNKNVYDIETLKGYIAYARQNIHPKLNQEATDRIRDMYVQDRLDAFQNRGSTAKKSRIPVTVRQLEAIIRLSEARAKTELSKEISIQHIEEAHRLFTESTINAIGKEGDSLGLTPPESLKVKVEQLCEAIKRKLNYNSKYEQSKLKEELVGLDDNTNAVEYAIKQLVSEGVLKKEQQGKYVIRQN